MAHGSTASTTRISAADLTSPSQTSKSSFRTKTSRARWAATEVWPKTHPLKTPRNALDLGCYKSQAIALEVSLHQSLVSLPTELFPEELDNTFSDGLSLQLQAYSDAFDRVIAVDHKYQIVLQRIKAFYDRICREDIGARISVFQEKLSAANKELEELRLQLQESTAKQSVQALELVTLRRQYNTAQQQLLQFVDVNKLSIVDSSIHSIRAMNARLAKQADMLAENVEAEVHSSGLQNNAQIAQGTLQQSLAQCQQTVQRLTTRVDVLVRELKAFIALPRSRRPQSAIQTTMSIRDLQRTVEGLSQGIDFDSDGDLEEESMASQGNTARSQSFQEPASERSPYASQQAISARKSQVQTCEVSTQAGIDTLVQKQCASLPSPVGEAFTSVILRSHIPIRRRLQVRRDTFAAAAVCNGTNSPVALQHSTTEGDLGRQILDCPSVQHGRSFIRLSTDHIPKSPSSASFGSSMSFAQRQSSTLGSYLRQTTETPVPDDEEDLPPNSECDGRLLEFLQNADACVDLG